LTRSGRRPGNSGSREAILAAARTQFAQHGYDAATLRGIAGVAEVDPALVRHYFGSKEGLFVAALEFPVDPAKVLPGLFGQGVDGLGERLVLFFLEVWDDPNGQPFLALLRSVTGSVEAAEMLRQFVTREVVARLAGVIGGDDARLRAALAGSQLVGLAMMRYVVRLEPIASAERAELARVIGPSIQRYLNASADAPGTSRQPET
jgi:AcrR family transcriptional regulator